MIKFIFPILMVVFFAFSDAYAGDDPSIPKGEKEKGQKAMQAHINEIALTRLQANIFEKKKRIFREKTGTKKTLFTTLITTYGLKENAYASYVDQVVTLKDLF